MSQDIDLTGPGPKTKKAPVITPKPVNPGDRIARNIEALRSQGATEHDIEAYLTQHEGLTPASTTPEPAAPKASPDEQFASLMAQGVSGGFAGKIYGGLDAADKYLHGDKNFQKNYEATRDRITGAESQGIDEHPVAGRAIEILSGALPFVASAGLSAPMTAARMGTGAAIRQGVVQGAKVGAGYGAVSGAGHATGGVGDYLTEMGQGAVSGAVFGGALGGAVPATGSLLASALDRSGLRPQATTVDVPTTSGKPVEIPASKYSDKAVGDPENRAILERPGFIRQQPSMFTARSGVGGVRQTGPFIMKGEQPQGAINFKNQPTRGGVQQTGPFAGGPRAGQLGDDQSAMLQRLGVALAKPAEARGVPPEIPAGAEGAEAVTRLGAGRTVEPGQRGMGSPGYVHIGAIDFGDPTPTIKAFGQAITPASMTERGQGVILKMLQDAGMTPESALAKYRELTAQGVKPETIMELAGRPGARLGRTIRAASPKAGDVIDQALSARAGGATNRAIQDALETSGIQQRSSGFQTTQQLVEQRASDAEKGYAPAFEDQTPITDARVQEVLKTPAGKAAWGRAKVMMANDGLTVPTTPTEPPPPPDVSPTDWANSLRLMRERGVPVPEGESVPTPTIQQAHYLKLALDDMARPGMDKGAGQGGLGFNEARSIKGVQKKLLTVMDEHSPAYAQARGQYAETSALKDANELGRNLWKMHPEEAAHAFEQLPSQAEKDVFRRAGMDALAQRLENGPDNVGRGASKPRDLARIRLLFPDDAAFQQFKDRIAREVQMHGTTQFATGGSQTADKLSDLADIMDVPMIGGPKFLLRTALATRSKLASRALADATAPMLTKGANGSATDLASLLEELQAAHKKATAKAGRSAGVSRALAAGVGSENGGRH